MVMGWFKTLFDALFGIAVKTPKNGISLIQKFEGLRLNPYRDTNGAMKIGYGSPWDGKEPTISPQQAEVLLIETLRPMENAVFRAVKVPLTPSQYSALVSLVYNIGVTKFLSSTLLRELNTGNFVGAADEFLRWDQVNGKENVGLSERREAERALFLQGPIHQPLS